MNKTTRETIFKDAAKKMRADFEDARNNVPHRGQAGAEGEEILITFLNNHLPGRFKATSGFIIDRQDTVSSHMDVIVYDALNCPIYRTSERGMIIPNDNVACVFEVKFSLTTTLLSDALNKIHEAKKLLKTNENVLPIKIGELSIPSQMFTTYGVIFAFECDLSPETVFKKWREKLSPKIGLFNSCSTIVILDRGLFTTIMEEPGVGVGAINLQRTGPATVGAKFGIGYMEFKDSSLDVMMRLLLPHLSRFGHYVDHPGYNFADVGTQPITWVHVYNGPPTIKK